MHWTILSDYEVFGDGAVQNSFDTDMSYEEVSVGPAILVVARGTDGHSTITRVISPNPKDYLRPEWQPGMPYHS